MAHPRSGANRRRDTQTAGPSLPRGRRPLRARWNAWSQQHRQSFRSSLRRLLARPWATLLTVLVMGIALALPLLLHVLLDNARSLSGGLREAREFTVFLHGSEDTAGADRFAAELEKRSDVAAVLLRTPQQGLEEFRQLSGFAEALDVLDGNPLPHVLVVSPAAGSDLDNPPLLAELEGDPRVDMVQYDAAWRQRLSAILGFGKRIMQALTILLGMATLLVVGNTVRMDIQARAEEIAVVQLMGASDGFVRRPFLYAGIWYGLLGGALAVLAVALVELAVRAPLLELSASYQNRFALHGFGWREAGLVIGASALLGWIGAWLVSSHHLRSGRPQQ